MKRIEFDFHGFKYVLETGHMAKQADGAVVVSHGETVVLATAVSSPSLKEGVDFLPLVCDYMEKTYAAGKIPGGFFKREGRPTQREVLTSRLIDRPLRPNFPKGYSNEVQITATVLSKDNLCDSDVLAITGASAALTISSIPFNGPIAAVRVGLINGKLVCMPSHDQIEKSDLDMVVAGSESAIVMVEGSAKFISEKVLTDALMFAHYEMQPLIQVQKNLAAESSKPKQEYTPYEPPKELAEKIAAKFAEKFRQALTTKEKHARHDALHTLYTEIAADCNPEGAEEPIPEELIRGAFDYIHRNIMRSMVLEENVRIDGRAMDEVRPISCDVTVLPRTHGSALFTRGETQALVITTLGTSSDEQKIESLTEETWKKFLVHYNFPPFATNEVKMLRSPGRREIGHGALAERALMNIMPGDEEFPYTIRVVSEILESNGSSSMATVCGGTLSLMDAGVPIQAPVAGIAMGLIKENDKIQVLTDILGDEDHLGDMDFKVAGTYEGVTAIQMDIKISGIDEKILALALAQAKDARLVVLDKMLETLNQPRKELSKYAPRIIKLTIPIDRIKDLIGPGGKVIKGIIEATGVKIDVEDDGSVLIFSPDPNASEKALMMVKEVTAIAEVGKIYSGTVQTIKEFGAFIEILPGVDGLCHISQIADHRIRRVEDVLHIGDRVTVKVLEIEPNGKIRLSMKAVKEENSNNKHFSSQE